MSNNLTIIGAAIISVGFLEIGVLVLLNRINAGTIVAFGFFAIFAGAIATNLNGVTDMMMSVGGGSAFHIQRVERQVDDKAAEVQLIGDQVKALATQVRTDAGQVRNLRDNIQSLVSRVQNSEKNIMDMHSRARDSYQALFDTLVFESYTRNLLPPPPGIVEQMDHRILLLGNFAYGPEGRAQAIQHVKDEIAMALKGPVTINPAPTQTPTP